MPEAKAYKGQADWAMFDAATAGGTQKPDTITYRKDAESGFYQVIGFNKPEDVEPEPAIWTPPKRKIAA